MLELRNVSKLFGNNAAVMNLSIQCEPREFLVIFGPAGAGKSTTLRLIAGVSKPSGGEIWFGSENLNGVAPEKRNMAMAFENYALYSHLTVFNNLAFPLRARRTPDSEVKQRVQAMADLLQISPLLDRRPGFLSGGQRQRVALGRALIREADVYLLDEPISHLDAKLRHHMRGELKAMCSEWESTVVYVTHDYKEAMALSDRIAVLGAGRLMQLGAPDEVYHFPAHEFVASYLGDPPMSFLDASLVAEDGEAYLLAEQLRIPTRAELLTAVHHNGEAVKVRIGTRATDVSVSPTQTDEFTVPAQVYVVETFGYRNIVSCRLPDGGLVQAATEPEVKLSPKDSVWLNLHGDRVHLFAADGTAISHPRSAAHKMGG